MTVKNLPLMRDILNTVQALPFLHDQRVWGSNLADGYNDEDDYCQPQVRDLLDPPCGTTLCIAGWAIHKEGHTLPQNVLLSSEFDRAGQELLGLTHAEASTLFYASNTNALYHLSELIRKGEREQGVEHVPVGREVRA